MKIKIICLLTVLLIATGVASSNNYCGGVRNAKLAKQVTATPVKKVAMMIDDMELLPGHHFLNNF
jgi:hypothetical protein